METSQENNGDAIAAKQTKRGSIEIACLVITLALVLCSAPVEAQQQDKAETIKLNTNLVVIDAQVLDRKTGAIINGLTARDFELYEDGAKQDITHFSQDKLSLSVILLIDLSGSVSPALNEIRDGALMALNRLKETDEVAVMAFSSATQLVQDFTTNRRIIVEQIGKIEKSTVIGQGTLLYPALRNAAIHMNNASNSNSRRVIVSVTDNVSWDYYHSGLSEKETSELITQSGSVVCGLVIEGSLSGAEKIYRRGRDGKDIYRRRMTIEPFAQQTGGEVIKATTLEVNARLAHLIDHLRTRYSLGFSPKRERIDEGFRQIRLTLTPEAQNRVGDVVIKTKQGYYARRRNT